jgi:uncharacterized delta-60 repeat protein
MKVVMTIAAFALAALVAWVGVALGSPAGHLDPSFDGDGRRILPFALTPTDVLVQPDGKIVLTDSDTFTVVRLDSDGSLDPGFGGDGVASADFGAGAAIESAALQPDGKIVVAGQTASGEIAVARFNGSGGLDASFDPGGPDGDGKRVYSGLQPFTAGATLVQPDGRIVIAGSSSSGITASRLTPSGAPDGTAFEHAGDVNSDSVRTAALAPDGKIVVAGHSAKFGSADIDLAVARFNADGTLDESLAGTGRTDLGPADRNDTAVSVLVQPDGKIVLATDSGTGEKQMVVTRLDVNGAPDTAFAGDGTALPDFVGQTVAAGSGLQPDGKILIAGTTVPGAEFAVARLDASGELDPSFGLEGKTTIPFDGVAAAFTAALQPDGRFVVAGLAAVENGTLIRTALARVLADPPPASGGPTDGGSDGGAGSGGGPGKSPSVPRCVGERATIVGTAASDTLRGTPRGDVIVALGGDDRISARGGNDLVCGGRGDDRLAGGAGADRLNGGRGKDTLSGGGGRDRLAGGAGRDQCTGGAARDQVTACERRRVIPRNRPNRKGGK